MGLGVGLILIAVGAIMAWAVHVSTHGFNIHTVGYILLVIGIIGALLSMIFWSKLGRTRLHHQRPRAADGGRGVNVPLGSPLWGGRLGPPRYVWNSERSECELQSRCRGPARPRPPQLAGR